MALCGDGAHYVSRWIRLKARACLIKVSGVVAETWRHRKAIGTATPSRPRRWGRNVVELNFNDVKQWRALATRYDKLAIVYRAAAVLRAVTLWLPHLSETP